MIKQGSIILINKLPIEDGWMYKPFSFSLPPSVFPEN